MGSSLDRTFTLTSTGTSASAAIKVSLAPSGAFTIPAGGDTCTGVSLGWKKSCTVIMRYTPAADYYGPDTLAITTTDTGDSLSASTTVPITVTPVDDAPVNTVPGAQSLNENTSLVLAGTVISSLVGLPPLTAGGISS